MIIAKQAFPPYPKKKNGLLKKWVTSLAPGLGAFSPKNVLSQLQKHASWRTKNRYLGYRPKS
jgi:hypothetical protein